MRMSRSGSEGERPLDICRRIDLEVCIALHVQWVMSHVLMSHVSRIKESCLTCQWVMSHVSTADESRSRVSYTNESRQTAGRKWTTPTLWSSWVYLWVIWVCIYESYECVSMSHMSVSVNRVAYISESCLMYEWLMYEWVKSHVSTHQTSCRMSHVRMSHVTSIDQSRHTYEQVTSHTQQEGGGVHGHHGVLKCTNESRLMYQWVMSHVSMSHVSRISESCLTYKWVISHVSMSHI